METTLQFRSFDGVSLEGTYTSGAVGSNVIAILVHGITSSRDELGLFSGLSKHLAREGDTVIQVRVSVPRCEQTADGGDDAGGDRK